VKRVYWDTSCVLKLYTTEENSDKYLQLLESQTEPIYSSVLLDAELSYSFYRKESRGEFSR
jgi:predicted nucleic acid-binding protein